MTRHPFASSLLFLIAAAPALAQVIQVGAPCPSAGGIIPTIAVQGAPFSGAPITIDVTGPPGKLAHFFLGFNSTSYGSIPLPFSFAPYGNPGCNAYVGPEFTISVPLNAQGQGSLTLPPFLPVGGRIFAQALILFGANALLDGATEAIEIVAMQPTNQPTIASLSVTAAVQGDVIVIRGANFGNGSPLDLCVGADDSITTTPPTFMRALSRTDNEIVARVVDVAHDMPAARVGFVLGSGSELMPPPLSGVTVPLPVFGWRQNNVTAANIIMSPQTIDLSRPSDDSAGCLPCEDGWVPFTLVSGKLVATLPPDLCDGVVFSDINVEPRWTDVNNQYVWVDEHIPSALTCGLDQNSRANMIAFLISFQLFSRGVTAFASAGGTITVERIDGLDFSSGFGGITYTYPAAFRATRTDGICDDFTAPTEPMAPNATLLAWQTTNYPTAVLGSFDNTNTNRFFMHYAPLPIGPGTTVVGATLHLKMRALGGAQWNDGLSLMVDGTGFRWGLPLDSLPGAGGTWNQNQELEICLNLARLPLANGSTVDLLQDVINAGGIEIFLQDDTMVDCLTVCVQRCQ